MKRTENIKQRLVALTDISNEPDDEQSLVRLLMYATDVDIEGLIATTSLHLKGLVRPDLIQRQLAAYSQILPNLRVHHEGYPDGEQLEKVVASGPTGLGMAEASPIGSRIRQGGIHANGKVGSPDSLI